MCLVRDEQGSTLSAAFCHSTLWDWIPHVDLKIWLLLLPATSLRYNINNGSHLYLA